MKFNSATESSNSPPPTRSDAEQLLRQAMDHRAQTLAGAASARTPVSAAESHRELRAAARKFLAAAQEQQEALQRLGKELEAKLARKPWFGRRLHADVLTAQRRLVKVLSSQIKSSTQWVKAVERQDSAAALDL